jgi:hypothetical protein
MIRARVLHRLLYLHATVGVVRLPEMGMSAT